MLTEDANRVKREFKELYKKHKADCLLHMDGRDVKILIEQHRDILSEEVSYVHPETKNFVTEMLVNRQKYAGNPRLLYDVLKEHGRLPN